MDSLAPSAPVATPTKPAPFSYGWDRTPYSPDETRASRDDALPDLPQPDDFKFSDLLAIFNPLQHIPVVSTIYRQMTGDKIHPLARVLGDTLFGGPLGFASAMVNNVIEKVSGKDIGDTLLAAVAPDLNRPAPEPTVAAAPPVAAPRTLGERLAAVFLPDRESSDIAQANTPAASGNANLGQRLAGVSLGDRAVAQAETARSTEPTLGQRLAAVFLPDRASAPAPQQAAAIPELSEAQVRSLTQIAPAAGRSGSGRGLADYQARPLDAPTTSAISRAILRPATVGPRTTPAALAAASLASAAPDAKDDVGQAPAKIDTPAVPTGALPEAPTNAWFAERMMMGLDLYRANKRAPGKSQVDRLE